MSASTTVIEKAKVRALQRAAQRANDAVAERNAAIIDAHDAGATFREIAEAVGMSAAGILKIVRRRDQ